jgi:alpha-1,6-mannosyltransferase
VALVALNPIYLMYAVGGFHNDFFMLVPMLGAVSLVLAGRDRSAGAVLMLAVAVKFTAVIVLPFLVVAAVTRPRRIRIVVGAAAGAIPLAALSLLLFGFTIPNLAQQSAVLTDFSIPNILGLLIGAGGGASWLLRLATVGLVLLVGHQLLRNRNWLSGVGWVTVGLLASLGWLMPWYVIWLLPFAALAGSLALRRVALGATIFLILSFMPATNLFLQAHNLNPLGGSAGQAAVSEQNKLEG